MAWYNAHNLILKNVITGLYLDPRHVRLVMASPPFVCTRYNYLGSVGFKISIGRTTSIQIPMSMLETLYNYSVNNNGHIYNRNVFRFNFPAQFHAHNCHVHVIGQVFVLAGLAVQISRTEYRIV